MRACIWSISERSTRRRWSLRLGMDTMRLLDIWYGLLLFVFIIIIYFQLSKGAGVLSTGEVKFDGETIGRLFKNKINHN
jgi:hypothetical protein